MSNTTKRETIKAVIGLVIAIICLIAFIILIPKPSRAVYDCRLSEISPDFPIDVKNECRRIRANFI